jgi:hypothetical protein
MAVRLITYNGAGTAVSITGLSTLASATLSAAGLVDNSTSAKYLDYLIEVTATVGTVSGNKQYRVFVQSSVDNTNFGDTTIANLVELIPPVQTATNATAYRSQAGSVAAAFGGVVPPKFNIYVYNDSGAAFTAAGVQWVGITETIS